MPDPNEIDFLNLKSYLFDRSYELVIGQKGGTAVAYKDIKMTFDLEKLSASTSNKCKIELYNVDITQHVKDMSNLQFELRAGYAGNMLTLFIGLAGGLTYINRSRKGPDIITTLELGDGEIALYSSYLVQKWPKITSKMSILKEMLGALGVPFVIDPKAIITSVTNTGYAICGPLKASIDTMAENEGLRWSITDGVAMVWKKGSGLSNVTAIKISKKTGLLGVPTVGNSAGQITTFTSLLNPNIKPGSIVYIESQDINGAYVVQTAHYSGDTHGNKWQVACECLPSTILGLKS